MSEPRVTFYVDRCLGLGVVAALRTAGALVEAHDDHFAQDAADVDWIPAVTGRGWVILTKDDSIRRNAPEIEAVRSSGARVVTLASGNMRGADMAALFGQYLADIERLAADHPPPFIAVLTRSGLRVAWPPPP